MNGAEALVRTLVQSGVELCLTNPGTSELHFVAALDRVPGMRPVLGLFEGVVSGAADGYARMAGKPAATLLHLGPGLGNALANLHNAKKARTPLVNLVGDHATTHAAYDAPLSSDVAAIAAPVSGWVRRCEDRADLAAHGAEAVAAAQGPPGQVATLVVPADIAWTDGPGPAPARQQTAPASPDPDRVRACAAALRAGSAALLLTGPALRRDSLARAHAAAARTGAGLFCDTFNARLERGAGIPPITPLPYFAESALETLSGLRHLVLVGTQSPVAFFAYPERPSGLAPKDCAIHVLADPGEDGPAALEALCQELDVTGTPAPSPAEPRPGKPTGKLGPASIGASLSALLPEGAIVSDECITAAAAVFPQTRGAAPHDWLFLTGGAIGQGMPLATGAALACPDRKVVCLEGDGSGMYTLQALWTQAREGLDVTTVVFANRSYGILEVELARLGVREPGPRARSVVSMSSPDLDWVELSRGMGVPARRAETADDFHAALGTALAEPGPSLVEAVF
ncbi:MAG: acetolactate synthase large subunit [Myxococcota bacterium]|nr:acetolactate synthase large subunit [Myxococcota bacterium]